MNFLWYPANFVNCELKLRVRFMPIYQYRCKECGHEIEILQGVNEPLLTDCTACAKGLGRLEKCITAASVRFAGGGYYETDEKPKSKQRNIASGNDSEKSLEKKASCNKGGCGTTHAH